MFGIRRFRIRGRGVVTFALAALVLLAGASQASAASSITAKVSAPPRLHQSPFRITFSAPVKNVDTTGALGTDLTVSDVKKTNAYPGQALCYDAGANPVDCGKGPVSSVQFTTKANLVAGQYYQVNLGAKIQDYVSNQPLSPSETVVRAQTVFGPNQWGEAFTWGTQTSSHALGGSFVDDRLGGASESYTFSGTSFGLRLLGCPQCGNATVTITQVGAPTITQTIDTYAATFPTYQAVSWSLHSGKHRFTITNAGTHDPASTNTDLYIDGIIVNGVENDTPNLTAAWAHPGAWEGIESGGATMTLTYYGTGVTVNYLSGPVMGDGSGYVDGRDEAHVIYYDLSEWNPSYVYYTQAPDNVPALGLHHLTLVAGDNGVFDFHTITIQ